MFSQLFSSSKFFIDEFVDLGEFLVVSFVCSWTDARNLLTENDGSVVSIL